MWRVITKALVFCFVSFVYRGEEGIQLQLLFFRKSVTISEGNRLNGPELVSSGFFLDSHLQCLEVVLCLYFNLPIKDI